MSPKRQRLLLSRYVPVALGLFLFLTLVIWVLPQRVERVVTDLATGEVRTLTAWDTSRLQAASAFWKQGLLLILALTALLGGSWWGRRWILQAAMAARFFAASLLVHSLLGLWLCAVPLAQAVVEHAEVIRVHQATQLFDEDLKAGLVGSLPVGSPAYEKVADPGTEKAILPELARPLAANLPLPDTSNPLTPTIPAHAVRSLPPERLLFVPPRLPEEVRRPTEIERRVAYSYKPIEVPFVAPELPPPELTPQEKALPKPAVTQDRGTPTGPTPAGPEPLRLPDLKLPKPAELRPEMTLPSPPGKPEPTPAVVFARREPGRLAIAAPREKEADLKVETTPADRSVTGAPSSLPRLTPPPAISPRLPEVKVEDLPPLNPPVRLTVPRPLPAELPAAVALPGSLPRLPTSPLRLAKIEEKELLPAPLLAREKEVRELSVEKFGGTKASEAAVERGLDWLAAHQNANGSWSLNNFQANCKHPRCADAGTVTSDPAGTGVALLPFLGAGNTHQGGKHQQTVARGVNWLVEHQSVDGTWPAPGDTRPMYGHGIASIVLCEAYGMTRDARLRGPAQKAIDYIVKGQHQASGGWRYQPNMAADTSVVGWQLMALKSAEMAGLTVPPKTFEGVKRWLSSVEANRPTGGQFGYQAATPTPAMTAQGLLCLQYLGARRDDPRLKAGTDYLLQNLPRAGADTSYYWYHATQVMYHIQGKHWKAWNDRLRDLVVTSQSNQGSLAGSWAPVDAREKPGGRLYATALRLLMLEVYYRHLPLYQQLEK